MNWVTEEMQTMSATADGKLYNFQYNQKSGL